MHGYILDLREKYGHLPPKKPQYSPHKHRSIDYEAKYYIVQPADTRLSLDDKGIKRSQGILGALLFVGKAVNNKLLVALSVIWAQQAATTEETEDAIKQLLDLVATYSNDGTLFRKSDMILAAHVDAVFTNEPKSRSRAYAHIFPSENDPKPKINGPVLTMAQIIKTVMALAAEAEMAALYITAKTMIPHGNTLIEMCWPQPQSPI